MPLCDVNNAASTKSGLVGSDRIGSDCSFRFADLILHGLAFGFRFSSKSNPIGFSIFFPVCLRSDRQISTSTDLEQPQDANGIERNA